MSGDVPLLTHFDSSAIERARYSTEARTLDIWFRGGDRYRYFDVPLVIYVGLRRAGSAGEFVNCEIKPRFRYRMEERRGRYRPG